MICMNGHIKIAFDPAVGACPLCHAHKSLAALSDQCEKQHLDRNDLLIKLGKARYQVGRLADALTVRNLELGMAKDEIDQLRSDIWLLSAGGGSNAR